MRTAYVTLLTWDWKPIGQITVDLGPLERDGKIDRSELDDVIQRAAKPLLKRTSIRDVHVFVHEGDKATPEEVAEIAKKEHARSGPDSESWGRNRRVRRPGSVKGRMIKK